jgi:hypothetical protein
MLIGVRFSNSKFFEETLDWMGVMIEPLPSSFKKLVKNRPLAQKYNCAICEYEI